MAKIYLKLNQPDSAYRQLLICDSLNSDIRNPSLYTDILVSKAAYFSAIGQIQKGLPLLEEAYPILIRIQELGPLTEAAKMLSEAYEETGNLKGALEYSRLYQTYSDSLLNQEKIREFTTAELNYEFEQERLTDSIAGMEEAQARDLAYQKDIAEQAQQKNLLFVGLGALALVVIIVIWALTRSRKQARALNEKNALIEKTLHEKQLLLKEVHHRVKNNFQVVSSLLELQSKNIEDEKARAVALEGKNRVKSMAFIHQKLYQNDDLLIGFSEYAEALVKEISAMYGGGDVKLDIDVADYQFDVDTAIPLGLILNELVTNAFKYGFTETEKALHISLDKEDELYTLKVTDNGPGLPTNFDLKKARSLGLRLINMLSKQLHGFANYTHDGKTIFTIGFKDTLAREVTD